MKNLKSLHLAFICVASLATTAVAQDGSLDASFGTGGIVITSFGVTSDARATTLQPDGKILAVGTTSVSGVDITTFNFGIIRYLSSGAIDSTFGLNGKVETDFGSLNPEVASAVAVQADGKIVVGGPGTGFGSFIVARYNANGRLDASFASGGSIVIFEVNGSAQSLAILPNGKILAAGTFVVRLNANGTLDNTFGIGGIVKVDLGGIGGTTADVANKVVVLPNGKVLLVGTANGSAFGLTRLNSNGTVDSSFGISGKVITNFALDGQDRASSAVVSASGKITVAGSTISNGTGQFALARYNKNGSLDSTFGTSGKVTTSIRSGSIDAANALVAQSDGKLVAIGYSTGSVGNADFALARYNKNGSLDATFGNAGSVLTDFGGSNFGNAGFLQPDGKIVAVGSSNFLLARYNTGTIGAAPQAALAESAVEPQSSLEIGTPQSFELGSNYPNPFNPSTVIRYQLPASGDVRLNVYDMLGREVTTLVNAKQAAGSYSVKFNAAGLSSGVYLYKLQAGSFSAIKKMLLVK